MSVLMPNFALTYAAPVARARAAPPRTAGPPILSAAWARKSIVDMYLLLGMTRPRTMDVEKKRKKNRPHRGLKKVYTSNLKKGTWDDDDACADTDPFKGI